MKPNIENFINNLSVADTEILIEMMSNNNEEIKNFLLKSYKSKRINLEKNITPEELSKEMSMSYLPILGISKLYVYYPTIYSYMIETEIEKIKHRGIGKKVLDLVDISVEFFVEHMNYLIDLHQGNIASGEELLNLDYHKKIKIILDNKREIYSVLSNPEKQYVFSTYRNFEVIKEGFRRNGEPFKREIDVLTILGRYSTLEDLESGNFNSFQKFIRK